MTPPARLLSSTVSAIASAIASGIGLGSALGRDPPTATNGWTFATPAAGSCRDKVVGVRYLAAKAGRVDTATIAARASRSPDRDRPGPLWGPLWGPVRTGRPASG